jgi:hypothetical protein
MAWEMGNQARIGVVTTTASYRGGKVRRIIRREHTSPPPAEERVALENDVKGGASSGSPQRADLHASPRRIDVGDLSTVALISCPGRRRPICSGSGAPVA